MIKTFFQIDTTEDVDVSEVNLTDGTKAYRIKTNNNSLLNFFRSFFGVMLTCDNSSCYVDIVSDREHILVRKESAKFKASIIKANSTVDCVIEFKAEDFF